MCRCPLRCLSACSLGCSCLRMYRWVAVSVGVKVGVIQGEVKCSTSACRRLEVSESSPAAQRSLKLTTASDFSSLYDATLGLWITDQARPSQCSTRFSMLLLSHMEPTAHTSFAEIAFTALSKA